MLGSKFEGIGRLGAWTRVGTLCIALGALVMVPGCPPVAVTCDVDNPCAQGTDVCVTSACNDVTGLCEDTAVAGCCNDDADCGAGEACSNNACVPVCTADADCDDTDACTDDVCEADGTCSNTDNSADCDDGLFCTGTETCDAATGCVDGTAPCAGDEVCNDVTDACDPTPCTVDADCPDDGNACTTSVCTAGACGFADVADNTACVDGDACTETDVCTAGVCAGTAIAGCCETDADCAAGETCTANVCIAPGSGFTLTTEDDAVSGTTGDDTFTGAIGTLNPGDIVVGNGGDDTMSATVAGATSSAATLIDIDNVNFNTLNATTFDAMNCAAIGSYNVNGTGGLTMTEVEADQAVRMGVGFDNPVAVALADATGGADEINLTVDGTETGASFSATDGAALETLNLDVVGSVLSSSDAGTSFFGGVGETLVTGAGDLTLDDFDVGDLAADTIDTTDFDGSLTLAPNADQGAVVLDFTAGGLVDIDGVDNYVVQDTMTENHTLTMDPADGTLTIDIAGIDADDSAGDLVVDQGADGTLNVNLGGEGDGCGMITVPGTDVLNIDSGGTTDNLVGDVTLTDVGFGLGVTSVEVNVTGDMDIDLGTVESDILTCTGATGGVTAIAAVQIQADCGPGDDDLTGSGAVDFIDAGDGDNTVDGAAGADEIDCGAGNSNVTGGAGADIIGLGTGDHTLVFLSVFAAAPTDIDGADMYTGFDIGDIIELDASNAFADGTGDLTNNDAATDDSIDIANDGTDTTIRIDLDTDAGQVTVTIVLLDVVLDDTDFTFDATNNQLVSE